MAGIKVKEEDEEEEKNDKKEKEKKEKNNNKIGIAEKKIHYYQYRFVIAILGLAKGVPFVDLFSCFFFIKIL
jgi:hypothetical protein